MKPYEIVEGEALAELAKLATASVDLVAADPPYSSGGFTRGDRTATTGTKYVTGRPSVSRPDFAGDNRDQRAYGYWSALWLSECLRVAKPGAVVAVFTDWRQLPTTTDAIQAGGWIWRGIVPWHKGKGGLGARPQMGRFCAACEFVVWGTAGASNDDENIGCLEGFFEASAPRDREHQTEKPLEVMREIVKICPAGGLVLDPFAGSGTTGVAALREGRRFLGFEITPEYSALARERLEAETLQISAAAHRAGQGALFGGSDG